MAYKTILVNLNAVDRTDVLIPLAVDLARTHQAHLVGLFVIPPVNIFPLTGSIELPAEVIELQDKQFDDLAAGVKEKFEAATRVEEFSSEWRLIKSVNTQIGGKVIAHAQSADLVIVSQGHPFGSADGQAELAERVVMETGRPVVIVPKTWSYKPVGEYVLVAWNATHQAARAAFDAVPVFKLAKKVTLCWVDPDNARTKDGEIAGAEMATTLARHDINVEATHTASNGRSIGQTLIDQISDNGADLIVMGGYGHSRFREYVFGGVTRKLLEAMTVPVLMSH